jgi:flavin reductase (DIM6/NTAB) family NADH-FMN oxidoreductase RutF
MPSLLPEELAASQVYDLLAGLVVPRPIAFVSTVDSAGVPNLAPFSFFTVGGVKPPTLCFCPVLNPDGSKKQTLLNIEETGEFVVNLVTRAMAEGMNATAVRAEDKWGLAGFGVVPSLRVKAERVCESPASFECRLVSVLAHGDGRVVVGEVVAIHVADGVRDEAGTVAHLETIARLGGARYLDLAGGKLFEMSRPKPPGTTSSAT